MWSHHSNSEYGKRYSDEELYNWCKYKFIIDTKYENFVSDERFDEYIVNKIASMKKKRNI